VLRGDGKGGTAIPSTSVDVQQPPPPPQATKVGDCGYTKVGASASTTLASALATTWLLRLKNDPPPTRHRSAMPIPKEPKADKLAISRADLAKAYIIEKASTLRASALARQRLARQSRGEGQSPRRLCHRARRRHY